jgi:hypothetical protein
MKLGGRRLVARRHSGVDAGVCGDEYRQIRPGVAGSCLALACDRRRGGGRGVSPPWRRSAGASVMAIVWQSPPKDFLKNHLTNPIFETVIYEEEYEIPQKHLSRKGVLKNSRRHIGNYCRRCGFFFSILRG